MMLCSMSRTPKEMVELRKDSEERREVARLGSILAWWMEPALVQACCTSTGCDGLEIHAIVVTGSKYSCVC